MGSIGMEALVIALAALGLGMVIGSAWSARRTARRLDAERRHHDAELARERRRNRELESDSRVLRDTLERQRRRPQSA